jgi:hypothetical protein
MEGTDPLCERLAGVAADLLSERRYQPALRYLFTAPAGVWQSVASCCAGLGDLPDFAPAILAEHADQFVVTHLPWPGLSRDDTGCMVLFAHSGELWSSIAFFNRATLCE